MITKIRNAMRTTVVMVAVVIAAAILPTSEKVWGSYPLVRNHTKTFYGADTQNWDIIQDQNGRMIFANKGGVLIFDGEHWELIPLDNYGAARSLAADTRSGRFYVGGSGTMGYLSPDPSTGILRFHPLRPDDMKEGDVGNIWNIVYLGGNWWFQGDTNLYRYDGRTMATLPVGAKINCCGIVGGSLHIATQEGLIYRVDRSRLVEIGGRELEGKSIRAIISHPTEGGKGLVVTASDGCMTLVADRLVRFDTGIDRQLSEAQVFCAEMRGGKIIFGTVSSGAIIKDFRTGTVTTVDRSTGLQNNTVLSAKFDRQENIWLGLDNGIDYVLHNAPVRRLLPVDAYCGSGYTSLLWGDRLLLGTNQGLFAISYPPAGKERPVRLLGGQVWALSRADGSLLVSTDLGLYAGTPDNLRHVEGIGGTWLAEPVNASGDTVLVSTYDRFALIVRDPGGTWRDAGSVRGFNDTHGKFMILPDGIWISDWQKGLFRLHLDTKRGQFTEVRHFSRKDGLPSDRNISYEMIGKNFIVSTEGGFSRLTADGRRFVPAGGMFDSIHDNQPTRLHMSPDGSVWSVSDRKVVRMEYKKGTISVDSTTYNMLHKEVIPGFDHISFLPGSVAIMSAESGFYELRPAKRGSGNRSPSLFICKVTVDHDSTFQAPVNGHIENPGEIPYKCPSVIFEAACTEHRMADAVSYSFFLEGYDKEWSPYSRQSSKEYTRLPAGDYTLKVRAVDAFDNTMLETEYRFTVATPWYLSVTAIIFYILTALSAVGIGVLMTMRYSRKSADRMIATKDLEISEIRREAREEQKRKDSEIQTLHTQQREQEIIHRSETLSASTKHAVTRNETLLGITESLEKLKADIPADSQQNVKLTKNIESLQEKISKAMSSSDDIVAITRNFDEVYGDYVARLTERYPTLSKSEIRLCCYIKMGLSTKEIAPLLNVAPKSIEMSRYRLRKKLELDRSDNLSDFLQKF